MQSYIHAGLGFHGDLLTDAQYEDIVQDEVSAENGVGVTFRSFSEDYEGKSWGTVVVFDFGSTGIEGKLICDFSTIHKEINLDQRQQISDILESRGLGHLIAQVKPIVYIDNY
jgi:hypothetical protein